MKLADSPIHQVTFKNFSFFVKRDDLLDKDFNGNKARKLYYFLKNSFDVKKVISYGSMQSNAMYSLSHLAKIKGWKFYYYTRINKELLKNPIGNLKGSLENGMILEDIKNLDIKNLNLLSKIEIFDDSLFIPEGVRCKEASFGIKILADEIVSWMREKDFKKINIFLPSGTGVSALYLQKAFKNIKDLDIKVYTTPCVLDEEYLKKQFLSLEEAKYHPTIIKPTKKYRFAKLYPKLFLLWQELKKETNIEFDLLYDPVGFTTLMDNSYLFNRLLYIHQGGLIGNESMIARYKRKFAKI